MKSSSFAKAITLGCLVLVAVPVACGDDTSNTTPLKPSSSAGAGGEAVEDGGTGGTGGTDTVVAGAGGAAPAIMIPGTSDVASTIKCGSEMCDSVKALSTTPLYVNPCCAGAAKDACGLDTQFFAVLNTAFAETCQAKNQEGPADAACPDSPDQMLPFNGMTFHVPGFVGCCRAETGTCGVVIDDVKVQELPVSFASPKLGCVDSTPFLGAAAAAKTCGAGGAGSGGAAGAGGASVGGAAAGGAGGAP